MFPVVSDARLVKMLIDFIDGGVTDTIASVHRPMH